MLVMRKIIRRAYSREAGQARLVTNFGLFLSNFGLKCGGVTDQVHTLSIGFVSVVFGSLRDLPYSRSESQLGRDYPFGAHFLLHS